jgi:hypothetical protein
MASTLRRQYEELCADSVGDSHTEMVASQIWDQMEEECVERARIRHTEGIVGLALRSERTSTRTLGIAMVLARASVSAMHERIITGKVETLDIYETQ